MEGLPLRIGAAVVMAFLVAGLLVCGCAPTQHAPIPTLGTPKHHAHSGMRLLEKGKLADAEREFDLAMELEPEYAPAHRGLGIVSGYRGDWKNAFQYMSNAEQLAQGRQERALAHVGFMRLYTQKKGYGWLEKAEACFRDAMKILRGLPDMPDPYYYMGLAYRDAFRLCDAAGAFKKVLEINKTLISQADHQLTMVQKIERAMPTTRVGEKIALLEKVKRIDVAALFIRELKLDTVYESFGVLSTGKAPVPPDVRDHPLRAEVQRAIELGIKGLETFPDGTFAPEEYILRASYAMMVADILATLTHDPCLKSKYQDSISPFADVRNDVPYFNAVMVCTSRGIMEAKGGREQNIFGPMDSVSGAEAVLTIRRLKEELRLF